MSLLNTVFPAVMRKVGEFGRRAGPMTVFISFGFIGTPQFGLFVVILPWDKAAN